MGVVQSELLPPLTFDEKMTTRYSLSAKFGATGAFQALRGGKGAMVRAQLGAKPNPLATFKHWAF